MTQAPVRMTVIPGRRIVGRPGTATRVQGRCEGRASATPSQLLPSVGTAGDRCLSCTRSPRGASAPVGRLPKTLLRLPKRLRLRLPMRSHPASKIFSHCVVAVRPKGQQGRSIGKHSNLAYGERYAAVRDVDPNFQINSSVGTILVRICTGVALYSRTSPARASVVFHDGVSVHCAYRSSFVFLSPDRATDSR